MKILVISCSPWRDDNNIGNSYTNIFQGIKNVELAHICCGSGVPKTDLVKKHLHINERSIINNLVNKKIKCCFELKGNTNEALDSNSKNLIWFDFARKHRSQYFFLIRDIIWRFNNWKCNELKEFVDDFNPDIIFTQFLNRGYLNEMIIFLKEYSGKPVVVYAWDDVYTLKQFSLSLLYWINRFIERSKLRNISHISSRMYVVSDLQQKEYSKIFHRECNIVYKGYNFYQAPTYTAMNKPLKLIYAGNIGTGRWKTLAMIGSALYRINKNNMKAQLYIYTSTPMSNKVIRALTIVGSVQLMGSVPAEDISRILSEGDILLHVESFDLKDKLQVRQSFSTKLVDYFKSAKCIFAVGSREIASIDYLIKNDAAIVATSNNKIITKLERLIDSPKIIKKYGKKAWECGRKNHQIFQIQCDLLQDFSTIIHQ